ncbi:MAG: putative transporter small subunit [Gordonia sp. (in: high G+C Gram-positive bacteria)]
MTEFWLTVYVLAWPVITAGTLGVIVRAFYREWRSAREEGRDLI